MMIKTLLYQIYWRKPVLLLAMLCFSCAVFAQGNFRVTGTVTDAQNQPLPGVTVKVKGETAGSVTDVNGRYTVNASSGNAILVFTYVGFKSQEVPINGRATVGIAMSDDAAKLNEVVVVGYGSQSRATISTAVTKLDNKVLENVPYANLTTAMQGTLAGVRVQTTTGQPGASARVIIRGGTSILNPNSSLILYIVDGIQRNDINDIASEDVETMQVLKDAASTSIYGSRASNGIVIITTKTGKAGKVAVNYNYSLTLGKVGRTYDIVNAHDYLYYGRQGLAEALSRGYITQATYNARANGATSLGTGNDLTNNTAFTTMYLTDANRYKLDQGWQSMVDPIDPTKTLIYQDTDWSKVLYQNTASHNHHVSLSGGTDKATFNAGIGYMAADGSVITTKYDRLSFNLNGSYKVRDNINVFGRVYYTNSTSNTANLADQLVFLRGTGLPRTAKYTFEDGTLAPGQQQGNGNPAYHLPNQNNAFGNETTNYSIGGSWKIIKGLSFDPQFSLYRVNISQRTFQPSYQNGPGAAALVTSRIASNTTLRTDQYQADAILTYTTAFGDHHLEAKTGLSYFSRTQNNFTATGQGASTDLIPTLNASSTFSGVSNTIATLRLPGYIGRINYDYNQKYLLTLNARYDGSSNFGADYRFGWFPGVSVGWVLNKEKFWDVLPKDLLVAKLRASYGVNGNNSGLSEYYAQGDYGIPTLVTQQRYNGNVGIQQNLVPNSNLRWERSKTFDFGADLGFLNNRLTVIFDYYKKRTEDLLFPYTPPPSAGIRQVLTNIGTLENKGFELEVAANLLPAASKVKWSTSANVARNTHKVVQLPTTSLPGNRIGGLQVFDPSSGTYIYVPANNGSLIEGYQIGDWYGFKALGVYQSEAEAAKAPVDNVVSAAGKVKHAGDIIWQDTDNNGVIDTRDKVYLGNPFPKWTGGFSHTVSYKNLSLYMRADFSLDYTIFNYARAFLDGNWQGDVAPTQRYVDQSWKPTNTDTYIPKFNPQDVTGAQNILRGAVITGISSQYVERGDYLAIREVTLSYNVPAQWLKKVKMSGLRLSVSGNNLHYFTKYTGPNPEDGGFTTSGSLKGDFGRYPVSRNIIFGANVTF